MQLSWIGVALFIAAEFGVSAAMAAAVDGLTALGSADSTTAGAAEGGDPVAFSQWSLRGQLIFLGAVGVGLKAVCWIVLHGFALLCAGRPPIPKSGRHLDTLGFDDHKFIVFNRLTVPVVTLHIIQFVWHSPSVQWGWQSATMANTVGAFVALFVLYDLVYTLFHLALHHRSVYALVHKHHHKQTAPSRGNEDAVNVHPFEFLSGEYLHLGCMWALPACHISAIVAFMVVAGVLASLNHTRHDFNVGAGTGADGSPMGVIYSVKAHDFHHARFDYNFGQYTMLWDRIFGTYRSWEPPAKVRKA